MSDPTDKQIAEAAEAAVRESRHARDAAHGGTYVEGFEAGARWVLAARQVPEAVAALVAEARGYTTDRARQNPEGAVDLVRRLVAALEVSSRPAPNREALKAALEGLDLHMQAGVPSHIILGRYEAGQVADALLAADFRAPATESEWEYGVRNTASGAVGYPWSLDTLSRSTLTEGRLFELVRRHPASEWESFEPVPSEGVES